MEEGQQLRRRSISPLQNQESNNSALIRDDNELFEVPLLGKNAPEGGLHSGSELKRTGSLSQIKPMNSFVDVVKQKIQITFKDVQIRTTPRRRRFYDRNNEMPETKIILDNVNGTILPG